MLKETLERERKNLLDLGLRNNFINLKDSKTKSVQVIEESSEEIFKILVDSLYLMSFQSRGQDRDIDEEFSILYKQLPTDEVDKSKLTDRVLQTPHTPSRLQRRLRSIARLTKLSIEEKGVNMLFLALGIVKWYESEHSDKERFAPVILVPVEIKRNTIKSKFKICYNDDKIGLNISFFEKLKLEFGITIDFPDEITSSSLSEIFTTIENSVNLPRWKLLKDEIRLGLFSFSKFLMWKDLDENNWDEDSKPHQHPLLSSFLGGESNKDSPISIGQEKLNDKVSLKETYHVLPADSSQQEVIFSIREGLKIAVVQGPPGTGKSQTITNIIADFLAREKKVLFVAEKLAALNVVRNRLESIGLGKLALELHSNKANKKQFIGELSKVMDLHSPSINIDVDGSLQEGDSLRDFINQYSAAVNTEVGSTGFTPIQSFGEVIKYYRDLEPILHHIDLNTIGDQSKDNYIKFVSIIEEISGHLTNSGSLKSNPFRLIRPSKFSFYEGEEFLIKIRKYLNNLQSVFLPIKIQIDEFYKGNINYTLENISKVKTTIDEIRKIDRSFISINIESIDRINSSAFENIKSACKSNIDLTMRMSRFNDRVYSKFWDLDCFQFYQNFLQDSMKWYKFILGGYKKTKKTVRGYFKSPTNVSDSDVLELLKLNVDLLETTDSNKKIREDIELLTGETFLEPTSNWSALLNSVLWIENFKVLIDHDKVFDLGWKWAWSPSMRWPNGKIPKLEIGPLKSILSEIDGLLRKATMVDSFSINTIGINELISIFQSWISNKERFNSYIQLVKTIDDLKTNNLDWVQSILENWDHSEKYFKEICNYYWFKNIARKALKEREILARFDGANHSRKISEYSNNEEILLKINKYRVRHTHWSKIPKSRLDSGKLGILKKELSKKRKLKPIRTLVTECGDLILDLKPLFLMSPMTVAQFIKGNSLKFDVVIFDEASQIKPEEAYGSILRGKQVVVVGDSKQLPPTSFFDSNFEGEEQEEEEFDASHVESILSLAIARNVKEKMLRWHYRSRHESLINVSNREFYNSNLLVFPSPFEVTDDMGFKFFHTEGTYYAPDKGGKVNRGEAKLIVQEVIEHARSKPEKTLGVVAFSQGQAKIIEDYIEQELRISPNPSVETYLYNSHEHERFFVKNLENVQGDERDYIFVSVGYGHQENGRFRYTFGPINKEGGERRLNVLFSRAKSKCVVFSNFRGDELDLSRTDSVGVRVLKSYLVFADRGEIEIPTSSGGNPDSVFEEQVASLLQNKGIDVELQVGSAGFRIDIAVKHPFEKGKYVLAIECDGASYHSSKIARDRDKARQSILENLGWKFYRIWSTDWFLKTKRESEKLINHVKGVLEGNIKKPSKQMNNHRKEEIIISEDTESNNEEVSDDVGKRDFTYMKYDEIHDNLYQPLHEYSILYILIHDIIVVEQPIHKEVILIRVLEATNTKRAGRRIQEHFEFHLKHLSHFLDQSSYSDSLEKYDIKQIDGFYFYQENMAHPSKDGLIRNRSTLSSREFNLNLVSPFEIRNAILYLVCNSYGMEEEDILNEVPKVFGFKRINDEQRELVKKNLDELINNQFLVKNGNYFSVVAQE
ncbi:MAG: DUF3320 domain-containing protein [Flavobacteriaceae bacterium]|nr:DUF3320 domain-containing protein [Flavobacteriaceae bacterium]